MSHRSRLVSLGLIIGGLLLMSISMTSGQADPNTPNEQMAAVLDQLRSFEAPPLTSVSPRVARELPTATDAVMAVLGAMNAPSGPEEVGDVSHKVIPGPADDGILIRIYTPVGDGPFPVIVYFHGGGWAIANLDTYDSSARALTNAAQAIVVSVAYRQAPEYPFPAAADDAYAATQWVFDHAAEFNGDPARVAVAGESAGGNLATVVTMMARDQGGHMPIYQALIYPVTQLVQFDKPSQIENEQSAPLNTPALMWFYDQYLPNEADRTNPYASPLLAEDLSGLPPATVITAQIDPLRSEDEEYIAALQNAGVEVASQNFERVTHEFFGMGAVVDEAKAAVDFVAGNLRAAFGN